MESEWTEVTERKNKQDFSFVLFTIRLFGVIFDDYTKNESNYANDFDSQSWS